MIKYRYERLKKGAKALNFQLPSYLDMRYLESSIYRLIHENDIVKAARIKVMVWRKKGGYYNPGSRESNLLLKVDIHHEEEELLTNVGISKTIRNYNTPYSQYKTLNALKYILASIEKQESGFDDLIILDEAGHVSELIYANISGSKMGSFILHHSKRDVSKE